MVKPKSMPPANRIPRKAVNTGCLKAWWYLEQNGSIAIYGTTYKGEAFSCVIPRKGLKCLRRPIDSTDHRRK